MSSEMSIILALLLPLAGAILMVTQDKRPNVRDGITLLTSLLTFGCVLSILPDVLAGGRPEVEVIELFPQLAFAFKVEPLGMLFALVASGLWIVTSVYAIGYMRGHHEENQTRFFICFALAISSALAVAFSRNLLTLFAAYEVLSLSTYPLVTHHGTDEAKRAGRVYLGILLTTSVLFFLFGIIWTWHLTGTLEFTPGGILSGHVTGTTVGLLLALFAFGTGKAALMPFHRWLPAAMVAPTPVSALLHAVAVVKVGVFTVLKIIVYIFGLDLLSSTNMSEWLMWVATYTILASSIVALYKDNLKARLAYSTISQLSYIVLGGALATQNAMVGAGLHIAMHAVGKITLFFCAGALFVAHHKKNISNMNGIGRSMPFTMSAFFLGSICIIGLPPMGGSWSKWYLALGAIDGDNWIFVVVLMVSSLLSIAYLMPVVVRAFFFAPDPDDHHHGDDAAHGHEPKPKGEGFWGQIDEAPMFCVVPLCLTAVGCILLFFYAPALHELLMTIQVGM